MSRILQISKIQHLFKHRCLSSQSEFVAGLALLHDDVTDVCHSIAAVGSRDLKKAMSFIKVRDVLGISKLL